jgi:hypothetical protein
MGTGHVLWPTELLSGQVKVLLLEILVVKCGLVGLERKFYKLYWRILEDSYPASEMHRPSEPVAGRIQSLLLRTVRRFDFDTFPHSLYSIGTPHTMSSFSFVLSSKEFSSFFKVGFKLGHSTVGSLICHVVCAILERMCHLCYQLLACRFYHQIFSRFFRLIG